MTAGALLTALGALLLTLGLPLGALWAIRRWRPHLTPAPAERRLNVVARLPVGRGSTLLLVEADGVAALVATGPAALTLLKP